MNIAVVLASGAGKRMGAGKNKVILKIKSKPLICYSLEKLEKSPFIDAIIMVCKKKEREIFSAIVKKHGLKKVVSFVEGGKERQESADNGLKKASSIVSEKSKNFKREKKNSVVLFHNGANPFLSDEEIENCIKTALRSRACAVAHPTKDTIKQVDKKGFVKKTLTRSELWNMQTPQAIRLDLAIQAFEKARRTGFLGTDDVSLVEKLGKKVKILEASPFNYKITTPLDLELAKIIFDKKYV